jgi:dolichyl-diphosphooligosaccharide--protein glycosyltransferase
MSKPVTRGKLRNPPRARQYATAAVGIAVLLVVGSIVFLYTTHSYGVFPAPPSSSSSSASTQSSSSGSGATSTGTGFNNTPCQPATTTSTSTATGTYALICTNLGLIEVQFFPTDAPKTVANFVSLAQSGFYNDVVWHRIVPGFVIQAGDPNTKNGGGDKSTWGQGTSGTNVPFEDNGNLHNTAGTIAMASTAAGAGGSSQFYINLVDNSAALDHKYAVFGKVINGMSIVQALGAVPSISSGQPINPSQAYIVSVTIQNTP